MKDTIYTNALERVRNGASFYVDLKTRSLSINGKKIISNGKYDGELGITKITACSEKEAREAVFLWLDTLYNDYRHSVPCHGEDEGSYGRRYFSALPASELTDEDIRRGISRRHARAMLEITLLCYIIVGQFEWTEDMGSWFWRSKRCKDFVILKNWIY